MNDEAGSVHLRELGPQGSPRRPALLMIHGNCAPAEALEPLAERLAEEGWAVILPELPGYGASPAIEAPTDELLAEAQRRLVRAVAERLEPGEEIDVLGHSFGFYRALRIALEGALPVRRMVGLGPLAAIEDEDRYKVRDLAQALRGGKDMSGSAAQHWAAPSFIEAHPELQAEIARWLDRSTPEALADETQAIAACEDLRPRLGALEMPIYLRVGALDASTPPEVARELTEVLPCGTLEVVDGVGHLLAQEDLEATARAVALFLEQRA